MSSQLAVGLTADKSSINTCTEVLLSQGKEGHRLEASFQQLE